jgi:UDP-N-acetylmuramoylalanine--D-glutamate ligase
VAVTGTNGKTTVAEWLGHVWREAGREVEVAGNVGTPVSSLIGSIDEAATVICECSSFQLEDSHGFAPEIAVLLNLTPDHLDRHGSLEAYRDAKLQIFARQGRGDFAIFDADLASFAASGRPGRGATVAYGSSACAEGRSCLVRRRGDRIEADGEPLIAVADVALAGEHNVHNAMAVAAASLCAGIPREALAAALGNLGGVPHRLEPVARIDGVFFVNDSKATNVAAADAALRAYAAPIRAILGGSLKGASFEDLAEPVSERAASVYLIGEAASQIERALAPTGVPITLSGSLEQAVKDASLDAEAGDVVLLAPASASFDAFSDYAERGDSFRRHVEELR